jgi:undecaprenyl-diphosphatase
MFSYISRRDHNLMRRLNGWRPPRWVRAWMILASRLGDGWLWWGTGIMLLLFGGPGRFFAVGSTMVSGAISLVLFLRVKKTIGRKRPCEIQQCAWSTLLPPDQFSFPSGHTMTAFSVSVPLSLFYPSLEIGLLFCAFSIALSRILLGLHFLSDVVVGAALGSLVGYTVHAVVSGLL